MKPNDKAFEAARVAILKAMAERNCIIAGVPFNENNYDEFDAGEAVKHAKVAVDAAFAAQFPPSEDYAELIETLRSSSPYTLSHVAADALEALLAERDALKKALKAEQSTCIKVGNERAVALLERDALLARNKRLQETLSYWNDTYKYSPANEQPPILEDAARLAPVDEDALVEIGARAICLVNCALVEWRCKDDGVCKAPVGNFRDPNYVRTVSLGSAWRQSRAAIAAIRPHIEAAEREKCAKIADERYWDVNKSNGHIDGWNGAVKTIAAAIRSGK